MKPTLNTSEFCDFKLEVMLKAQKMALEKELKCSLQDVPIESQVDPGPSTKDADIVWQKMKNVRKNLRRSDHPVIYCCLLA